LDIDGGFRTINQCADKNDAIRSLQSYLSVLSQQARAPNSVLTADQRRRVLYHILHVCVGRNLLPLNPKQWQPVIASLVGTQTEDSTVVGLEMLLGLTPFRDNSEVKLA